MKVRYYGHIGQSTGYGRAAEEMCMALLVAGVELEIRPLSREYVARYHALPLARCVRLDGDLSPNPDVIIVHTLPLDCHRALTIIGVIGNGSAGLRPGLIAYTTWEGACPVPLEIAHAMEPFDQVWVPSTHNANDFLQGRGGLPGVHPEVHVMPHAFDEEALAVRRSEPQSSDYFQFYYLGAWTGRKNPAGLVRAWARAFNRTDQAQLNLHCAGADRDAVVAAVHATGLRQDQLAPVSFDGDYVSDQAIVSLHRTADCFVTATRGEAFNLPAFEAVLAGRQVICPGGMGSDDFLNDTDSVIVNNVRQPAAVDVRWTATGYQQIGAQGLDARVDWLEPDLTHLAQGMRRIYGMRKREMTVHYDPAIRFGRKNVGVMAKQLIEGVLE